MSQNRSDKPRTGTGDKARGKKPSETGLLQMRQAKSPYRSTASPDQPKGWGIAKVVNIFRKR